jgi:hypothetical protein
MRSIMSPSCNSIELRTRLLVERPPPFATSQLAQRAFLDLPNPLHANPQGSCNLFQGMGAFVREDERAISRCVDVML